MVSTRSQKNKEKKPDLSKPIKAEKVSTDKKKSQTKQVKNQAKEEKKKEKETVQNDQKTASSQVTVKNPKPKQKEPKKPAKMLGYTADQYAKYKELIQENKDKSNEALKEILRKNEQKVSGSKYELADRVADGMVLGAIPKCPNCGGGRPKFDFMKGTYYCPGYRDDVDFVNCHKTYTLDQLPRNSWVL
ncbi:unnamed protein product [Blepharisma stoltei]|uniref:PADR1 domain-containing protein n=1 Tax=Blepharisma stoltei TaxID=1481888 RepID=A0AAU9JDN7_9CILI|nr:unnamed protein product [Blepharisma stoltei]